MAAPPERMTSAAARNRAGQTFLVLFPGAVGCLLCGLILDPHAAAGRFLIAYITVALAMALVGVIAPLTRIKKPLRAYRMLQGIGRSPLSRQAALVASFLSVTVVLWVLALAGVAVLWLDVLAIVVGFVAVLAAALSYVLGSQPGWRLWPGLVGAVATLLALGIAIGLVVALGWREALLTGSSGQIAAVVLALLGVGGLLAAVSVPRPRVVVAVMVVVAGVLAGLSLLTPWLSMAEVALLLVALFLWRSAFLLEASADGWRREVRWLRPQTDGKGA